MESARSRNPGETVFAVLMLACSVFLFWHAYRISGFKSLSSPGSFPMAVTATMIVSSAVILFKTLQMPAAAPGAFKAEILNPTLGLFVALNFFYAFALEPLGFVLTSFLFLFSSIYLLHRRGPWPALLSAVISVVAVYVIFRLIFKVVLPEGIIPERQLLAMFGDWLAALFR
jgi:putative tricarboxylic transport membrane protein